MVFFENFFIKALCDTGVTHSFITIDFVNWLSITIYIAPFQLKIISLMGFKKINVHYAMIDDMYIKE